MSTTTTKKYKDFKNLKLNCHNAWAEPIRWLAHDTSEDNARQIAEARLIQANKSEDEDFDGFLVKEGAPKVAWFAASLDGAHSSVHPRRLTADTPKRRFLMPAYYIRSKWFDMFFVNFSKSRTPNWWQIRVLFVHREHRDYIFCEDNFQKLNPEDFWPLQWDEKGHQWTTMVNMAIREKPQERKINVAVIVAIADIEDGVPWPHGCNCKRLDRVLKYSEKPRPSVVQAPKKYQSVCRSHVKGYLCNDTSCKRLHDTDYWNEWHAWSSFSASAGDTWNRW